MNRHCALRDEQKGSSARDRQHNKSKERLVDRRYNGSCGANAASTTLNPRFLAPLLPTESLPNPRLEALRNRQSRRENGQKAREKTQIAKGGTAPSFLLPSCLCPSLLQAPRTLYL